MTNYNEKLDEILDIPNITRMAKEEGGDVSDIDKHIQLRVVFYDGKHETYPTTLGYDLVKQAITSLTKELVAEAKPEVRVFDDGINDATYFQQKIVDQFEQNLLKALEEN